MDNLYPKSKQTEGAISSLFMYLYQSYTEEQGLSQEQAKAKVVATIEEGIKKFRGDIKEEVKQDEKAVNINTGCINNSLATKSILNSLEGLKLSSSYRGRNSHIKYFVDTIDFNFKKLIENNELK